MFICSGRLPPWSWLHLLCHTCLNQHNYVWLFLLLCNDIHMNPGPPRGLNIWFSTIVNSLAAEGGLRFNDIRVRLNLTIRETHFFLRLITMWIRLWGKNLTSLVLAVISMPEAHSGGQMILIQLKVTSSMTSVSSTEHFLFQLIDLPTSKSCIDLIFCNSTASVMSLESYPLLFVWSQLQIWISLFQVGQKIT